MSEGRRTLIVGAGIGGLTAATALSRRGFEVEVVESAPEFSALGSGITVQANGRAVFDALGIELPDEDVVPIGQVEMLNPAGKPLVTGDPGASFEGPPSVNVHRADLHRALLAACEGVPVRMGVAATGVEQDADGVTVTLAEGAPERWDHVIGADGVHSVVRRALLGEAACRPRYSGQTCWRFAIEAPDLVPRVTIERWGVGRRIGLVPLARGRIYVYIVLNAPEGTPAPGSASADEMRRRFSGIDDRLDPLLERLDASTPVHHGDLIETRGVHYGVGRVLLIGDAAHGMTPNMGQGAGQAIEDVGALAILAPRTPAAELPAAMDAMRRKRVTQIHRMSWRIGQMAHWQNPVARWLRDRMLMLAPESTMVRQTHAMWQAGVDLGAQIRAADAAR